MCRLAIFPRGVAPGYDTSAFQAFFVLWGMGVLGDGVAPGVYDPGAGDACALPAFICLSACPGFGEAWGYLLHTVFGTWSSHRLSSNGELDRQTPEAIHLLSRVGVHASVKGLTG